MISVELRGRLGNQLFQYVTCRSIAEKLGYEYTISSQWLGKNIFDCGLGIQPYIKQKTIFEEGDNSFNKHINNIKNNTHLHGYWQSEKYFLENEENVRKWLYLSPPTIDENICAIHLRAQDAYIRNNYILPIEYFNKAKKYIINIIPNIKFVIITDNINKAKNYFPDDIIIKNNIKTDMQTLIHSKYKIISNSSFSWWSAWLGMPNSKIIIAPDRWMNHRYNKNKKNKFYPQSIKTKNFIYI